MEPVSLKSSPVQPTTPLDPRLQPFYKVDIQGKTPTLAGQTCRSQNATKQKQNTKIIMLCFFGIRQTW